MRKAPAANFGVYRRISGRGEPAAQRRPPPGNRSIPPRPATGRPACRPTAVGSTTARGRAASVRLHESCTATAGERDKSCCAASAPPDWSRQGRKNKPRRRLTSPTPLGERISRSLRATLGAGGKPAEKGRSRQRGTRQGLNANGSAARLERRKKIPSHTPGVAGTDTLSQRAHFKNAMPSARSYADEGCGSSIFVRRFAVRSHVIYH